MTAILVTGAAGFIGSHVAERLLSRGEHVIGVDEVNDYYLTDIKLRNISLLSKQSGFKFYRCSLSDTSALKAVFNENRIERVAHLAARAGVRPSIENPELYERANVHGTLNLLECIRQKPVKNLVLASSSSVYGNSRQVPFKEDDAATDRPISPYAATKKATEVMAYTYHQLFGLKVNVVRPFTVYGPRGRPDMAPWLFIEAAVNGRAIAKFGDGSSRRDYTYIDDFVDGFVNAIDREFGYEIFNLGNSHTISLNEALETVSLITGKQLIIEQKPMQPGDVEVTYADISKARAMLDYEPKTAFQEGMRRFHEWFLANGSR
ncbi:MAG: GDP-mannose 4,6-dehydratase [Deltaproteobacteria bacterium]|nr:GDP-mannose 4,6-dehydratase [Deltaproteobacteria bacterium]